MRPCRCALRYERKTVESFCPIRGWLDIVIARGLAYAPYCDLIWCETSEPNFEEPERFAREIHAKFSGKLLAYNCSPSFNWKQKLNDDDIASFQRRLGEMGYMFQFVTLAGFHALNLSMFELASSYATDGMFAYSKLQQREFGVTPKGYGAVRHQRFVGIGYFDLISTTISGGETSTNATEGSTEEEQFEVAVGALTKLECANIASREDDSLDACFSRISSDKEEIMLTTETQAPAYLAAKVHPMLPPSVTDFIKQLDRRFEAERVNLLDRRNIRQAEFNRGVLPGFLPETADIRDSAWQVAPAPEELEDRRVEITGPTDRKMVINALNSGARVFMADFEDSTAPSWANIPEGQQKLAGR